MSRELTAEQLAQLRADIERRKALPAFDADTAIERIKVINATQRSFTLEVVEALLDELERKEALIAELEEKNAEILRQARSFREAHDSAAEIIRRMERSKPVVTLPATRLWAGKVPCFEEKEIVSLLVAAGINLTVEC